jgi:AraC-like DNA-binding protein
LGLIGPDPAARLRALTPSGRPRTGLPVPRRSLASLLAANPPDGVITAADGYRLRAVAFDVPTLMVVLSGTKRLGRPPAATDAAAGRFVMVHTAGARDVENLPGKGLPYRAWAVPFDWRLVGIARELLLPGVPPEGPPVTTGPAELLERPIRELLALPATSAAAERDLRRLGLLLALARLGQTRFLDARDPSFVARVRALVAAEPARSWSSPFLERRLAVSGATLRRRLAAARTSLREVVREARLQHGLGLLQTTRMPIKSVAFASGYRSATSFSRNFLARYGVDARTVSSWRDGSSA